METFGVSQLQVLFPLPTEAWTRSRFEGSRDPGGEGLLRTGDLPRSDSDQLRKVDWAPRKEERVTRCRCWVDRSGDLGGPWDEGRRRVVRESRGAGGGTRPGAPFGKVETPGSGSEADRRKESGRDDERRAGGGDALMQRAGELCYGAA